MRRRTFAAVTLVALLASAGVAAARSPHAEKIRLDPDDVVLAKKAVAHPSDLTPGWKGGVVRSSMDDASCPGFDPDLSAFTITGMADSKYARYGADILAHVEVYASRRQASTDFRLGAKAPIARCFADAVVSQLRRSAGAGVKIRLLSTRVARPVGLGERAFAAHVVVSATNKKTIKLYSDFLAFQRGRSIAALVVDSAGGRLAEEMRVARLMAARMR